jgi:hypothetical protein
VLLLLPPLLLAAWQFAGRRQSERWAATTTAGSTEAVNRCSKRVRHGISSSLGIAQPLLCLLQLLQQHAQLLWGLAHLPAAALPLSWRVDLFDVLGVQEASLAHAAALRGCADGVR